MLPQASKASIHPQGGTQALNIHQVLIAKLGRRRTPQTLDSILTL